MTDEGRLREMQELLGNYEEIQRLLQNKSGELDSAFDAVANGVARLFRTKIAELREQEAQRTVLANRSRGLGEEQALQGLQQAEVHNRDLAMILAQSILLILKHIETARTAVRALSENHDLQNEVFRQLSARVALYRDLWEYQQRAAQLQRDIGEISRVALEFNTILAEQIGPVYELVAEVARVDDRVATAMAEIEALTAQLANNRVGVLAMSAVENDPFMQMLVYRRLTHDAVQELLSALRVDDQALPPALAGPIEDETVTVPHVLDNIERLIDAQLAGRLWHQSESAAAAVGGVSPGLTGRAEVCPVEVRWTAEFEAPRGVVGDTTFVAVLSRDTIQLRNVADGTTLRTIVVHGATAGVIHDCRLIYAVEHEVYDLPLNGDDDAPPRLVTVLGERVTALACSTDGADGRALVAALTDGTLRDTATGAILAKTNRAVNRLFAVGGQLVVQTNRDELIGYSDGAAVWRLPGIRSAWPQQDLATADEGAARLAVRDVLGECRWITLPYGLALADERPCAIGEREVLPWMTPSAVGRGLTVTTSEGPILAATPCGVDRAAVLTRGRKVYVLQRRD